MVTFAPDHEQGLDVGLEAGDAIDDVHAHLFQRLRPVDVGLLVEAGFQLEHADDLLAALRGPDQGADERRVVAGPVDGQLDGEHIGITAGLGDEPLHRGREGVVRMVDQNVALADDAEHVGDVAVLALKARLGDRGPGLVPQVRVALELDDVPEVSQVEQSADLEDFVLLEAQHLDQLFGECRVHRLRDLEPHHFAETAAADLFLDGFEQVVGFVGDVEVGVPGDPEVSVVDDFDAREELVDVGGDHVLERHHHRVVLTTDVDEAAEQFLGHLDASQHLGRGLGVAQQHRQREREVGDVRERTSEADHQGRQGREDLVLEDPVQPLALGLAQFVQRGDADAFDGQGRAQVPVEALSQSAVELQRAASDRLDLLLGREAVGAAGVDAGVDLVPEPGHAHHEEFVEVRCIDGTELDPLEQRDRLVFGQLEDPLVEVEPGELAVEIQGLVFQVRHGGILSWGVEPDLRFIV